MANKHLSRQPKHLRAAPTGIQGKSWFYEESGGFYIVTEPHDSTCAFVIPWKQIRNALARKDRAQEVKGG